MEFQVLGPVQVLAAGQQVPAGEPRQRAVLAALLLDAGRPVSNETLVDRVWGRSPPDRAVRSAQAYIARIRRLLARAAHAEGEDDADPRRRLTRDPSGYRLRVDPDKVDALRFRALLGRARRDLPARERADVLAQALALWRGEPLTGIAGGWAGRVREALRQERIEALVAWSDAEVQAGNPAAAIGPLTELCEEQPRLEPAAAALMRALYAAGRPSDALDRFDRIRRRLRDELGADPGPLLRDVHAAVLRQDLGTPAAAAVRAVPAQLPADVPAFTGRTAELAELDRLVAGHPAATPAVLCVTGTAGVGKTATAVHWGHRVRDRFPDGELYVDLRGFDPGEPLAPADALAALLAELSPGPDDLPSGTAARAARLRTALAGRRMLVVLDNAATVEQVRPLLPGTPTCLTLVTSRDSLAGLVALHGARRLRLDALPAADAVGLLRRLAGPRVDEEPGAARTLVDRCARLPLAIRVAAELMQSRPAVAPATLVGELVQRRLFDRSGGDPRAAVGTVFSWSLRHLSAAATRMFAVVGTHPGPDLDQHAAAALAGVDLDEARLLLAELARGHLVHQCTPDRWGMHELLRAYAGHVAVAVDRPAAPGGDQGRPAHWRTGPGTGTTSRSWGA
jgi:DNA-binding SARP family transcriptional activator